jgi:curli production assembly/transport component CsgG
MTPRLHAALLSAAVAATLTATGCAVTHPPSEVREQATLTTATAASRDLRQLPPPKGKIAVAVYGIRDQTGQYKASPDSSFSTAVTQGASSMLIKSLKDSGWFVPVERENLQNLLTERKIVRALEMPQPAGTPAVQIPPLLAASVLIEGGIVAYESNVRTGGVGARFLGIGMSTQYRVDQVTVNLRTVDIRGGQILQSVSTTKTIYSYELHPSVFKFVNVKDLAEFEAGTTRNEPTQLCVSEAIEAAVTHLIVQGIQAGNWTLKDDTDLSNPVVRRYLEQAREHRPAMLSSGAGPGDNGAARVAAVSPGSAQ